MADYTDNALLASMKALEKVVLPALDPADPLAGEQLRLVLGFLKFLRLRLPLWQARVHFELAHYLGLAQQLASDARQLSDAVSLRLDAAIEQASALQRDELPTAEAAKAASAALATAISALARVAATAQPALRREVERRILAGSRQWVDMQRAWFAPQGFEMHPAELPPLDMLLGARQP